MTESAPGNPVLVEVVRGTLVESRHRGAIAVADAEGRLLLALGDVARPVYPRSAVKALQAIPLVESGAADAFGLDADESSLACGAHWPVSERTTRELLRDGRRPQAIHNNCSGKHAGMLATAVHLGLDPSGYEQPDHGVQVRIARILSETCGVRVDQDHIGVDGCSVPTFALPLSALARGFARLGTGKGLAPARANAAQRLIRSCFASPVLVAGEERFDTIVLRGLARSAFVKGGAEGVHCAVLPELGLGIALKIDDGTKRGAERALGEVLAALLPEARNVLADHLEGEMHNWRGLIVGRVVAGAALERALADLDRVSRRGENQAAE
jgi:L-asparaginase II